MQWGITSADKYRVWNGYGNRYWPRDYLVDNEGYIICDHVGEGGYNETDNMIRSLLAEPGTNTDVNRTFTSLT